MIFVCLKDHVVWLSLQLWKLLLLEFLGFLLLKFLLPVYLLTNHCDCPEFFS